MADVESGLSWYIASSVSQAASTAAPTDPSNPVEPPRSPRDHPQQPRDRVVEAIHDPFFQGSDGVVGEVEVFGANRRAALGDVAVADAVGVLEILQPVVAVERVQLQGRRVDEVARPDELGVLVVIAQDVADILAE